MPEYNIRVNGVWRNVCSEEVFFRHQVSGEWKKFKSGDSVRIGNNWVQVNCGTPCGQQIVHSGGKAYPTPYEAILNFGSATGITAVECRAGEAPDKFEIWYNNVKVADTGYIGDYAYNNIVFNETGENMGSIGYKVLRFNKNLANVQTALLRVYAPLNSTLWEVHPKCPGVNLNSISVDIESTYTAFLTVAFNGPTTQDNRTSVPGGGHIMLDNHTEPGENTFQIFKSTSIAVPAVKMELLQNNMVVKTVGGTAGTYSINWVLHIGSAYKLRFSNL